MLWRIIAKFLVMIALLSIAAPMYASMVRYAVIVGNNEGHDTSQTLLYEVEDVHKIYYVLLDIGDFKHAHIQL